MPKPRPQACLRVGSAGPGVQARRLAGASLVARLTANSEQGDHVGLVGLTGKSTRIVTMVPVRRRVAPRLAVHPSALFASGVERGAELTAQLVLEADENESFGVTSVTADGHPCTFTMEGGAGGSGPRSLRINVKAPPAAGAHRLALRIETDLSGSLPVIVPWSMTVR